MPVIQLRGVEINFPYEPYPIQVDYMVKVLISLQERKHAILESPTGTGKTLCLLCSTLAWKGVQTTLDVKQNQEKKNDNAIQTLLKKISNTSTTKLNTTKPTPSTTKIIYCTRTHSQIVQVVKELKNTIYRPRCVIVGSRTQYCINPSVCNLLRNQQIMACKRLCKDERCDYHTNRQLNPLDIWVTPNSNENRICDIEDLCSYGEAHHICPYFLCHDSNVLANAELILLPYNYLIDANIRKTLNMDLQNCVILFDEAHNLDSVCTRSMTIGITSDTTASIMNEINELTTHHLYQKPESLGPGAKKSEKSILERELPTLQDLYSFKVLIQKFEMFINKQDLSNGPIYYPGEYIYSMMRQFGLFNKNYNQLLTSFNLIKNIYDDELLITKQEEKSSIDIFIDLLTIIFDREAMMNKLDSFYILIQELENVHTNGFKSRKVKRSFSVICNNSGYAIQSLIGTGIYNIILTSGTLSPLHVISSELQLSFGCELQNRHVIQSKQLLFRVISNGPNNKILTAKYSVRNSSVCKYDYGITLLNIFLYIPDCMKEWKSNGLYNTFSLIKEVFSESDAIEAEKEQKNDTKQLQSFNNEAESSQSRMNLDRNAINGTNKTDPYVELTTNFVKAAHGKKGGVLFAVCRGKASEGIDFSDDLCRCVIVIGIPYAPPNDPYIYLRKQWLNQHALLTETEIQLGINHRLDEFISRDILTKLNSSTSNNALFSDSYFSILDHITPKHLNDSTSKPTLIRNSFSQIQDPNESNLIQPNVKTTNNSYNILSHNNLYLTGSEWYSQSAFRAVNQAIGRVIRHKDDYGCILLLDERYKWSSSKELFSNWLKEYYQISDNFKDAIDDIQSFFHSNPPYSASKIMKDIQKYSLVTPQSTYSTEDSKNKNNSFLFSNEHSIEKKNQKETIKSSRLPLRTNSNNSKLKSKSSTIDEKSFMQTKRSNDEYINRIKKNMSQQLTKKQLINNIFSVDKVTKLSSSQDIHSIDEEKQNKSSRSMTRSISDPQPKSHVSLFSKKQKSFSLSSLLSQQDSDLDR